MSGAPAVWDRRSDIHLNELKTLRTGRLEVRGSVADLPKISCG